jgi:hypothetical protein
MRRRSRRWRTSGGQQIERSGDVLLGGQRVDGAQAQGLAALQLGGGDAGEAAGGQGRCASPGAASRGAKQTIPSWAGETTVQTSGWLRSWASANSASAIPRSMAARMRAMP